MTMASLLPFGLAGALRVRAGHGTPPGDRYGTLVRRQQPFDSTRHERLGMWYEVGEGLRLFWVAAVSLLFGSTS